MKAVKQTKAEKEAQEKKDKLEMATVKAKYANNSSYASAVLTSEFAQSTFGELDVHLLHDEIKKSADAVKDGDLKGLEVMLVGQQRHYKVFVNMARRGQQPAVFKAIHDVMSMVLKAQAQSRATIQALVELKYLRQVIVAKQADFSGGHNRSIMGWKVLHL